jgi:hypothetical protein
MNYENNKPPHKEIVYLNDPMDPQEVTVVLQEANAYIQEGFLAQEYEDSGAALVHFQRAYELYKLVLPTIETHGNNESKAVHYRSLATLAVDCGLLSEGQRYARKGLACVPPGGFTHSNVGPELQAILKGSTLQSERIVSTILNSVQFPDNEL